MGDNILIVLLLLSKISLLPSINDTILIKEWIYLGPFSTGAREGVMGVDERIDLNEDFVPDENLTYPSILTPGGKVKWQKVQSDNGEVVIEYKDVLWDTIQDYYGAAGVLCAGYAYGDFKNTGINRALVIANGVSSFKLNGKTFPGDRYKEGYLKIPVLLKDGKNRTLIKLSGFGDHKFTFKIVPAPEPLMIIDRDITKPDILRGESINNTWLGIPVVNTMNRRLFDIQLQIKGKGIKPSSQKIHSIMPLSAIKVPVKIESEEIIKKGDSLLITAKISFENFSIQKDFWIKVKNKNESYVKTFISKIDNSCQYYAVLPPENYNKDSTYALIMTCHGAGVKARNQVNAYAQKGWAFIVAPTNRRRFGFDWQDWGRIDFFEVLEDVKKQYKIDTNRIYLTGHSMGGHGVWHIGTSHPGLFAAIAPSAGWTNFQLYIPWFLQKSEMFAHPDLIKFRDMVLREDNPLLFLENLMNVPVYILQGGADDNVPPIQARMFTKYLHNLGYDYIYKEVEGQRHWWNVDSTPGVDCVDSEELMNFLRAKVRNPYPKKVVFKTTNVDHSNQTYWVRIDELEDIYQEGAVKAEVCRNIHPIVNTHSQDVPAIIINTKNISRFTISLNDNIVSPGMINLFINGQKISFKYKDACELSFMKHDDAYLWATEEISTGKRHGFFGPIKKAYFKPFILIYGTMGDLLSTENNLHQARLQCYAWWYRANGFVEILPDTEVTEEIIKNYNLILFGNAETNSFLKWINHKLPIRIEEGHIIVNKKILKQKNLCLVEIYPNPLNTKKFVLLYSPTSKDAEKIMGLFSTLYSGAGLPDYIVYDKSVLKYGWADVVATGFFDKDWKFSKTLSYIKD